jgi:hypothetical protein
VIEAASKKIRDQYHIEYNGGDMDDDGSVGLKMPPLPASLPQQAASFPEDASVGNSFLTYPTSPRHVFSLPQMSSRMLFFISPATAGCCNCSSGI